MFTYQVNEDISLRLLMKKDAKELFTLVNESRSYLREWLPWVDSMKKESDYEPIIEMWLKQFSDQDGFQTGISFNGKLVGMIGLQGINRVNSTTEVGYWLAEEYQGNGIMSAAVKVIVNLAFNEYDVNRVTIQCGLKNIKSQAIPKRLGFTQDGIIREAEYLYDHYHDLVLYSMLAKEWGMDE